jgi:hypothetical protein
MNYYIIKNELFNDSKFAYGTHTNVTENKGTQKVCEKCKNNLSLLKWLPPHNLELSKKKISDFIFGTYPGVVFSKKVKDIIKNYDLRGVESFFEVNLLHKKKTLDYKYYYGEISIDNIFINLDFIEFEYKSLCTICQKSDSIYSKINGVFFSNIKDINNDIFFTSAIGQSVIIVSEKFKHILEKEKVQNLEFIKTSEYKWDYYNPKF